MSTLKTDLMGTWMKMVSLGRANTAGDPQALCRPGKWRGEGTNEVNKIGDDTKLFKKVNKRSNCKDQQKKAHNIG